MNLQVADGDERLRRGVRRQGRRHTFRRSPARAPEVNHVARFARYAGLNRPSVLISDSLLGLSPSAVGGDLLHAASESRRPLRRSGRARSARRSTGRRAGTRGGRSPRRGRSAARTGSRAAGARRRAGAPESGRAPSPASCAGSGTDCSSPFVYGLPGAANSSRVGARSKTLPAYMTMMWSVMPATTPRSCVMRMTLVPVSLLQLLDELENLRLDGDVERGRRLVGDEQLGLAGQRHRDHHALAHAARELVRVAVDARARIGDADRLQHLDGVLVRLLFGVAEVQLRDLHQLPRDAHEGVERGHRVLEDHRDALAANLPHLLGRDSSEMSCPSKSTSPETMLPGRARDEADDREVRHGLARPRLADDAERLAAPQVEADAVDGLHGAVLRLEVRPQVSEPKAGCRCDS